MGKHTNQPLGISDGQIVDMYWRRDEQAIRETDKKYGRMLYGIAYNILHDHWDCEECQNDAYLGVWNAIPPTRPLFFSAFITEIMRRTAVNRWKEKNCKKRIPSELTVSVEELAEILPSEATPPGEYEAREIGDVINDYVRTLNQRQRYVFIDRFYMAESVETIAKDLSVSVPTVYRDIEKIKRGLKQHLERNGIVL